MIKSANFATHPAPGRLDGLTQSVKSIIDQVDVVRIFWNEYTWNNIPSYFQGHHKIKNEISGDVDRKDNGKFHHFGSEDSEYYFTCDDDILYPDDYVKVTVGHVKKHQIICYHGRELTSIGNYKNSYYQGGHLCYSFQNDLPIFEKIHVPGTGVMCVDTRKIKTDEIFFSEHKGMVDLVFALWCTTQWKERGNRVPRLDILVAPHRGDWIKSIRMESSICTIAQNGPQTEQIKLVREILHEYKLL